MNINNSLHFEIMQEMKARKNRNEVRTLDTITNALMFTALVLVVVLVIINL